MPLPTYADVTEAGRRLSGIAHRTPVLTSSRINTELGLEVYFKAENLQRMGAFKFRGAYNALAALTPDQRARGVVAFSSGNHAQAVALAARLLQISATIVMPTDAPTLKRDATKGYGAEIVTYDRYREDREMIANDLAQQRGLTVVPPFNHPDVIAGQGTAADELLAEIPDLDAVFTPLGGGGLLAGTALSVRARSPKTRLFGVEPEAGNDALQSLRAGHIVTIATPRTIADGAQTTSLGDLTFEILRRDIDDVYTATDEQLVAVMRTLAATMKTVVEPTGCLGAAGLVAQRERWGGKRVGVILSGGNVDMVRFARLIESNEGAGSEA